MEAQEGPDAKKRKGARIGCIIAIVILILLILAFAFEW